VNDKTFVNVRQVSAWWLETQVEFTAERAKKAQRSDSRIRPFACLKLNPAWR